MSLRLRILLGYGYLVGLLLLSAAGAALGFHQLGQAIGRVLAENFASVEAGVEMLEALERQDSALLGHLVGKAGAREALASADAQMLDAVGRARDNVTLEGEAAVVEAIAGRFAEYRQARSVLLETSTESPLGLYEAEAAPRFEAVKGEVFRLIELNEEAMVEADRYARRSARRRAVLHGLLVTVALLSLGFLSREMQRRVLDRLDELKSVAQAIATGRRERRASVGQRDELGLVAAQLNAALDSQEEVAGEMHGRLAEQRQALLALLATGPPRALYGLSGELVASTLDAAATRELTAAVAEAREAGRLEAPEGGEVALEGGALDLRLLRTPAGRRVGWLATPGSEPERRASPAGNR